MSANLETVFADIKNLVLEGKAMEAFEKYYGEDVVMQENENPAVVGKEANRQRELDFFSKITEFRGAEVKSVAYGDNTIISEWFMDYTHADFGNRAYNQVSVQEWQDGKVKSERYYYGT